MWDKSLKKRNGSLKLLFRKECDDTDLSQSSIVKFLNKSLSLLCFGLLLGEAEGVEEIEGNRVRDELGVREVGEVTWLSSTHVMLSSSLGEPFEESNKEKNLPLSSIGQSIPLLRRGSCIVRERRSIETGRPGEVKSVGLSNISC